MGCESTSMVPKSVLYVLYFISKETLCFIWGSYFQQDFVSIGQVPKTQKIIYNGLPSDGNSLMQHIPQTTLLE